MSRDQWGVGGSADVGFDLIEGPLLFQGSQIWPLKFERHRKYIIGIFNLMFERLKLAF